MKKFFLFSLVLAIFASCSQNEVVEQPLSDYICFSNAFVDNSTRADNTITKDNINSFTVWGHHDAVEVFRKVNFNKVGGAWQIEDPSKGKEWELGTYYFHAFAPAGVLGESSIPVYPETTTTTGIKEVPFNNTGDVDFCYAYATRQQGDPLNGDETINTAAVGLSFNHLLSRAKFTVKNTSSKIVKVSNITISSPQSGSIDLTNSDQRSAWQWKNQANIIAFSLGETSDIAASNIGTANNILFLIPNPSTEITIKFSIVVPGAPSVEKVIKMDHEFKLGYSYNFIATIADSDIDQSTKLIEFTVDGVVDWAGESLGGYTDVTVQNK